MNYPERIKITEVGPRDGIQNLQGFISTDKKMKIIDAIIASGIKSMEITSFVHPKAVPQMADAAQIAEQTIGKYPKIEAVALIPNLKGALNAYAAGVRNMTYVISATEEHNRQNVNRTKAESFEDLKTIIQSMPDIAIKLSIATVFGCPYRGDVFEKEVFEMVEKAMSMGIKGFALCDTIGVANPSHVAAISKKAKTYEIKDISMALHMHNTRGMGLANALAAMDQGIGIFETSIGGLGGCPFAPGAAGNTATEDLVNMLNGMGVKTNIDLNKYLEAVKLVKQFIQQNLSSSMAMASRYNCLYVDEHSI